MIATLWWTRERCRWLPAIIATLESSDLTSKHNMRASQHRDRETAVDGRDVFRRIFEPQIQFSAGECFL
jgi:hypothetical protein